MSPLLPNSDNVSQWVQSEEVSREGSWRWCGKIVQLFGFARHQITVEEFTLLVRQGLCRCTCTFVDG